MRPWNIALLLAMGCTSATPDQTDTAAPPFDGDFRIDDGPDIWDALRLSAPQIALHASWYSQLSLLVYEAADAQGIDQHDLPCPAMSGDSTISMNYDGGAGCTVVDGFTWAGSVHVDQPDARHTTYTYDHLVVEVTAEGAASIWESGSLSLEIDGVVSYAEEDDRSYHYTESTTVMRREEGALAQDGSDDTVAWVRDTAYISQGQDESGGGQVQIITNPDGDHTGSFAITVSLTDASGCAEEQAGTIQVEGASVGVLTVGGSTPCDGCYQVTIDGEDRAEPWCHP